MSLKIYTIHKRTSGGSPAGRADDQEPDVILVPEGFSLGAFLFQVLWALYHRLWRVALAMFAAMTLVVLLLSIWLQPDGVTEVTLEFAMALFIGAEAANFWAWELGRRGYRMEGVVMADNLEEAERRYFEESGYDGISVAVGDYR